MPLIASGILYASNGTNHVSYIDALFNCISAVTVCGLATLDLSGLTIWQQVILFLLMCMGSPVRQSLVYTRIYTYSRDQVVVSWVMVYVRREIFADKFRHIVEAEMSRRVSEKVHAPVEVKVLPWWKKATRIASRAFSKPQSRSSTVAEARHSTESSHERGRPLTSSRLRPEMIRRMDDAPKLVNPSGYISEGHSPNLSRQVTAHTPDQHHPGSTEIESTTRSISDETDMELEREILGMRNSEDSTTQAK